MLADPFGLGPVGDVMRNQTLVLAGTILILSTIVGVGIPSLLNRASPISATTWITPAPSSPSVATRVPTELTPGMTAPEAAVATGPPALAKLTTPTVVSGTTALPTLTALATLPSAPTSAAAATGEPVVAHVGNTNGQGVFMHHNPTLAVSDRSASLADGTPLVQVGPETSGDGEIWVQVRDQHGRIGWIIARYVVRP
jgi:hypothetical protein